MIFDSNTAKALYAEFAVTHDPLLLERLHNLASDLIKIIAISLNKGTHYEDLVQEGHLKFHRIVLNQQFRTDSAAAMYTFLSKVLRNHMIDYLRRTKEYVDLDSVAHIQALEHHLDDNTHSELFGLYYANRFPTLPNSFVYAEYIYDAVLESLNRNKIVTTLTLHVSRPRALILYKSVSSFLRITSVAPLVPKQLLKSLNYANNGKEFTLYPECALIGCNCTLTYKQLIDRVDKLRLNV